MIRKTINRIASSKLFLLIISIVAAVALWLYVVNVENTEIEVELTDIPVEFLGQDDILADRQLLVAGGDEQTVSMTLRGRRSVVANLTRNEVHVTVDLTDIRNTGNVARVWNVSFPDNISERDIYVLDKSPEYVSVEIDRMGKRTIDVTGDFHGNTAEGYKSEPMEFSPSSVTVTGPEEIISRIDAAQVTVQRENLTRTVTVESSIELLDEDGNAINSQELTLDTQVINVTLPVVMVKEVALNVELIDGGGATSNDATVEYSVSTVTLSGSEEVLAGLNQITVGRIDLSSFERSTEETFPILIPNEVNNESGEKETTVRVQLHGLETRTVEVTAANFEFINVTEGYQASCVRKNLPIVIRGPALVIDEVQPNNIHVVVDARDKGNAVGMFTLGARVYVDGFSQVGAVGDYTILVELSEISEEEPGTETTDSNFSDMIQRVQEGGA